MLLQHQAACFRSLRGKTDEKPFRNWRGSLLTNDFPLPNSEFCRLGNSDVTSPFIPESDGDAALDLKRLNRLQMGGFVQRSPLYWDRKGFFCVLLRFPRWSALSPPHYCKKSSPPGQGAGCLVAAEGATQRCRNWSLSATSPGATLVREPGWPQLWAHRLILDSQCSSVTLG